MILKFYAKNMPEIRMILDRSEILRAELAEKQWANAINPDTTPTDRQHHQHEQHQYKHDENHGRCGRRLDPVETDLAGRMRGKFGFQF